ncbi:MAG: aconitate hydratase 1 [Deltaproteobacteria bacterium RIFOXYA12_FULL_61_11]|nr:MAG: aconitate hydratase 1 [Deltaproteobacteria bacterium RIFOXYA12_FULL_61_11]
MPSHDPFGALRPLDNTLTYYALDALQQRGLGEVSTLPYSLRILLEALLRTCDGASATDKDVLALAGWEPGGPSFEFPFLPARVVLQDFTGVPCLVDLAALRTAVQRLGGDPRCIEPRVPADLVIDHSIQVDVYGTSTALNKNMEFELQRNRERYVFLKWGQQAFAGLRVVPPGVGIIHQVNLEHLASGVHVREAEGRKVVLPDSCVGTDSHTTMINGLGILGWGVGGIEAEAVMLGKPLTMACPKVVGVELRGRMRTGVTATDLTLLVTERLRKVGVVGAFVEYHGEAVAELTLPDRATIANMCPEYGATIGFFPMDRESLAYLRRTGRPERQVALVERYARAQGLLREAGSPIPRYDQHVTIDLGEVRPCLAGPKRPQDRVELPAVPATFAAALTSAPDRGGFGLTAKDLEVSITSGTPEVIELRHGSLVLAAITSCTNTSNPSVMLGAGLLAKKARARGLTVPRHVKTSLAPGSRVVQAYLASTGLLTALEELGFHTVGFGCTTCIGNSGPLPPAIAEALRQKPELVVAAILSGNRNFEGRINPQVKANYLASPPLVVAYALAGRIDLDLTTEPLAHDNAGHPVYLSDLWPSTEELAEVLRSADDPDLFRSSYAELGAYSPAWAELETPTGAIYPFDATSTYLREPPFLEGLGLLPTPIAPVRGARVLALLGDSVTTDHISPAGSIQRGSPAATFLETSGVKPADFNSYGARRGNDQVMVRGTLANVRLKNGLVPGVEGGYTIHLPSGERMWIYEAARRYRSEGVPLILLAGSEYGTGSSRDWAAKGVALLGVRAVLARSYERIHRSNLIGMGVLPLQFKSGQSAGSLGLTGHERFDLHLPEHLLPGQDLEVSATAENGHSLRFVVDCRVDTPMEARFLEHGGILPMVLREFLA